MDQKEQVMLTLSGLVVTSFLGTIQFQKLILYYTFHCYWVQLSLRTLLSAGSSQSTDMASELSLLVLSSCMLAGGQTLCSFSGIRKLAVHHRHLYAYS